MKVISLSDELLRVCPDLKLGCIEYNVDVEKDNQVLWSKINQTIEDVVSSYTLEKITEITPIKEAREIYKRIGKEPSRYRISSEALIRRIVQGKVLYKINNVVDVNNLISITTKLSVGSYDVNKLGNDLTFRIGKENESYKGIGKEIINIEKLPVFSDEEGAYGSPTSDSERAMITQSTKNVLTVLISFSKDFDMENALKESVRILKEYVNAKNIETCISQKI